MCEDSAVDWIYNAFGECVVSTREKWSFGIGLLSNVIWLICSSPQIYQNCKTKRVDGQSPFLFSLIFIGDLLSLIGLFVNGGLFTQILQSFIFGGLDGICFGQFIYYKHFYKDPSREKAKNSQKISLIPDEPKEEAPAPIATPVIAAAAAVDFAVSYTGKKLAGTLFGWVGASIYISSRVPQLISDFKARHVHDISPMYITFSIMGNVGTLLSILLKSFEAQYLWNQLPWIVSSSGPLLLDILSALEMIVFGYSISGQEDNSGYQKELSDLDENPKVQKP